MTFTRAFIAFTVAALLSQPTTVSAVHGTSQMTGGNLNGGTCMFNNYTFPKGIYGADLAGPNWDKGNMCGACLHIAGERGELMVMVVDECPGCPKDRVNIFQDAFSKVGDPTKGTIDIEWNIGSCRTGTPIKLRNKTGSSKYWFEMQVLNSNLPVTALDVSTDNGQTWQATERQDYNYFKKAGGGGGFGSDTVTVRVTCLDGIQVIAPSIGVKGDTEYTTPVNC